MIMNFICIRKKNVILGTRLGSREAIEIFWSGSLLLMIKQIIT